MRLLKQKSLLKKLRARVSSSKLDDEFREEIVDLINTLIGRVNCYSTDDDEEVKKLAIKDDLYD